MKKIPEFKVYTKLSNKWLDVVIIDWANNLIYTENVSVELKKLSELQQRKPPLSIFKFDDILKIKEKL